MVDDGTRKTLSSIPLLQNRSGPRDKELWVERLKEEYLALIKVIKLTLYEPVECFYKVFVVFDYYFVFFF